jgi:hypothetical protein
MKTAETQITDLQTRIEKQVAELCAAIRGDLEATRISKARAQWLLEAVSGTGSDTIH